MDIIRQVWAAIDGGKTFILMILNGALGLYMGYFDPELVLPAWFYVVDMALFGGAMKSAIKKTAPK